MRFGLDLSQQHLDFDEILRRAKRAEFLGFEGVWVGDHFQPNFPGPRFEVGTYLEAWSLLAALAVSTTRIRMGVLVSAVTHRHPSVLAAQAATVDVLSGGRLDLGLGSGWAKTEHRMLGIPFPAAKERTEMLDEAVDVIRLLLTADNPNFEGRHYQLNGATYRPRPIQRPHPPIWIGGGGERSTIPIAARQADAWHTSGEPADLMRKSALLSTLAADAGRDPASIVRATDLAIADPWPAVRQRVDVLAQIGFSYLIVSWPAAGLARLEEFAEKFALGDLPEARPALGTVTQSARSYSAGF